jgi:hypothetical protein
LAPKSPEINSATIEELNVLLAEIEERMKRLRPQFGAAEAAAPAAQANAAPAEPAPYQPFSAGPAEPDPLAAYYTTRADSGPPVELSPEERDAAFLERHPYLRPERLKHVMDVMNANARALEADEGEIEQPVRTQPAPARVLINQEPELQLVRRHIIEEEEEEKKPGPPTLVIPDTMRFKTYLALAVMAGIVLVGAPVSAVVAYRYLHPVYFYDPVPQQPADAAPAAADPGPAPKGASGSKSSGGANSGTQSRPARPVRRGQAARQKQPIDGWPAPRPGDVEVWPSRHQ